MLGYTNGWTTVAGGAWNAGEWHHGALVYDADALELFDNGGSQGTASQANPSFNSPDLWLGGSQNYGNHLLGTLDEVRIRDVARTADQLRDNMHRELTGDEANPVAYFPMNQQNTTALDDLTANNHDGALVNMDAAGAWVDSTVPCADAIDDKTNIRGVWDARTTSHGSSRFSVANASVTAPDFAVFGHDNGADDWQTGDVPATIAMQT